MKAHVAKLTRFSTYRDGGSLSMSFLDHEGKRFRLFLKVALGDAGLPSQEKTFPEASLDSFTDCFYTSPVTKETLSLPPKVSSEIVSWESALEILNEAGQYVDRFESDYKWVYQAMLDTAQVRVNRE